MNRDKQKLWDAQSPIILEILDRGFADYFESLPNHESAFVLIDRHMRCIDEGTGGGIHLGGSGILLAPEKAVEYAKRAEITGVYSHEGCGAAALAGKDAQEWSKVFAEWLLVPYLGHISATEMNRPESFHDARVIYYDGTGNFSYTNLVGLPKGFTIHQKYLDVDYAQEELRVALEIAFGDHGFAEMFTDDEPLLVIAMGDKGIQIEAKQVTAEYKKPIRIEWLEK